MVMKKLIVTAFMSLLVTCGVYAQSADEWIGDSIRRSPENYDAISEAYIEGLGTVNCYVDSIMLSHLEFGKKSEFSNEKEMGMAIRFLLATKNMKGRKLVIAVFFYDQYMRKIEGPGLAGSFFKESLKCKTNIFKFIEREAFIPYSMLDILSNRPKKLLFRIVVYDYDTEKIIGRTSYREAIINGAQRIWEK